MGWLMVTPKNNLPPESQQWRRDMERRLAKLETSANNLQTAYKSSDARLGSLVNSVKVLGDTVTTLGNTITTLDGTVDTLDNTVEALNNTGSILGNQIHFSSQEPYFYPHTLTTSFTGTLAFDSTYDQEVSVTIPSSTPGPVNAVVWFGSWMTQAAYTPEYTVFGIMSVNLEMISSSGTETIYIDSLELSSDEYAVQDQLKPSAPYVVSLLPGETYTFRTRRSFEYTRYSKSTLDVSFQTYPIVVLLQFVTGA